MENLKSFSLFTGKWEKSIIRRDGFFLLIIRSNILLHVTLALLFCSGGISAAEGVSTMLRFPQSYIKSGESVMLKAYFYNESQERIDLTFPKSLSLSVRDVNGSSVLVTAIETDSTPNAALQPGEFLTKEYKVFLPSRYQGTMKISLADSPDTEVLINILSEEQVQEVIPAESKPETVNDEYPSLESLFSLYQPYIVNFAAYEPLYFLLGTDPSESKFQISFKYRPINPVGSLAQKYPWLTGLNLAYTQTSFWDLASSSAPFEDTSYKPEIFYLTDNWPTRPEWMQGLFFQGGFRHESNGRGGELSRSTNTLYFKPIFIFYNADSELGLQFSPKLFIYVNNSENSNPNLDDYRGNVEFEVKFGKADGLVSSTRLHVARQGTSVQTDLSYPISKLLKNNFDLFFHVQYSYSLAESLINYRERTQALRIGISIVR